MTKLDWARQIMSGQKEFPPSGVTLGLKMLAVDEGATTVEMPVDERFLNRAGAVQGGILASLADANMGTALSTVCDEDETHATLEMKINFLRPAPPDSGPLVARSEVLHRSKRVAHTTSEIRNSVGELVAKATASWVIRKTAGPPPPERE